MYGTQLAVMIWTLVSKRVVFAKYTNNDIGVGKCLYRIKHKLIIRRKFCPAKILEIVSFFMAGEKLSAKDAKLHFHPAVQMTRGKYIREEQMRG